MNTLAPDEQPIQVDFHTADGVFIKHIVVAKRNTAIPQHAHVYGHSSVVAAGGIAVWKDEVFDSVYHAPATVFIAAGVKHTFVTVADNTVILCIHNLHNADVVAVLAEHQLTPEEVENMMGAG